MSAAELSNLGRYKIERVLGRGAMGVVYEALDPRLNRRIAIKTILKTGDKVTADISERFLREAQAVARLNHPNIVQIHDFGEEGEIAYIVMEFVRGTELRVLFDAGQRFELDEAVRIMCQLCDALDFAHNAGIIHRDVKPGNVILDEKGQVKLADFGIARVSDSHSTATMVGTPAYMSPEQINGAIVDRRTDVFSAGIILYQFLTGHAPFAGAGVWTTAKQIMMDPHAVPSSLNAAVGPFFDSVVDKALAKDREQRYQTARDLARALRSALDGKKDDGESAQTLVNPATWTAAPRPAPSVDSRDPGAPTQLIHAAKHEAATEKIGRVGSRKPTPAVLWAIAGVAILALGAYLLRPGNDSGQIQQMQQQLDQLQKKAEDLARAKQGQEEAQTALRNARAAEADAKRSADSAKLKESADALKKAEAEAKMREQAVKAAEQQRLAAEAKRVSAEKEAAAQERERQHWDSIKSSLDPGDFEKYLAAYPKGRYADLAHATQTKLRNDLKLREEQERKLQLERAKLEEERRKQQARMEEERARDQAKLEEERRRLAEEQRRARIERREVNEKQSTDARKPAFVPPSF